MTFATKNPPRETATVATPAPKVATASDYRQLLLDFRKQQLRLTHENLQRLAETYDRAARNVVDRVSKLPDERRGTVWHQAQFDLLRSIDEELTRFRTDYAGILDLSMLSTAQQAAERELATAKLVNAPEDSRLIPSYSRGVTLFDGGGVSVQFGRVAFDAVEATAQRFYRDGLQLSQRLHNLDTLTRQQVENTLVTGLTDGSSARDIAKTLQDVMSKPGVETPKHHAMRLVRTEINNSQRESSIRATMDAGGNLKSYISGIRWNLSSSHPHADICDVWAGGGSEGLDPGVYLPNDAPLDHPHGLCFVTAELVNFPGIGGPGKKPDVAGVPESQIRYYAETIQDPVAQAALAARGAGA